MAPEVDLLASTKQLYLLKILGKEREKESRILTNETTRNKT